jgi:hypothetical protein
MKTSLAGELLSVCDRASRRPRSRTERLFGEHVADEEQTEAESESLSLDARI